MSESKVSQEEVNERLRVLAERMRRPSFENHDFPFDQKCTVCELQFEPTNLVRAKVLLSTTETICCGCMLAARRLNE